MNDAVAYPQLFETVPDALIVVDGSGHIVAANGHAERLFGYGERALLALPIEALMILPVWLSETRIFLVRLSVSTCC